MSGQISTMVAVISAGLNSEHLGHFLGKQFLMVENFLSVFRFSFAHAYPLLLQSNSFILL